MDSEKDNSLTKMDKIRIVIEYNELKEKQRPAYLKDNGISREQLMAYQAEAASMIGGGTMAPPPPKTPCEKLLDQLALDNEDARREAAKGLGKLRFRATSAVQPLIDRMLNDPVDFVKTWSAWALTRIEPRNPAVIEAYRTVIVDDECNINARKWAMVGLSVSDSKEVEQFLMEVARSKERSTISRIASLITLQDSGLNSPEFIELLKELSKDDEVKDQANFTLKRLQPKE